jgi:predicted homoserine dehydrogenase-like protein
MTHVIPLRPQIRVGISGTGFIGRGLLTAMQHQTGLTVYRILTRRPLDGLRGGPERELVTNSITELIAHSDVVVECSGDVAHATEVVSEALDAQLPVVTMNSEFHVTVGSWFANRGVLTEAAGDQPGALAELAEQAEQATAMGFRPLVYGNLKRFQDNRPSEQSMQYWAKRQGISIEQVTAFTTEQNCRSNRRLSPMQWERRWPCPACWG